MQKATTIQLVAFYVSIHKSPTFTIVLAYCSNTNGNNGMVAEK